MNGKILILVFGMILLVGMVSALDFDNVKYYDEETKTITIENTFGLGRTLAEYTLTDNTDKCLWECYAEGTLYLDDDNQPLFDDIEFKNKVGDTKEINDYKYFLLQEDKKDFPIYKEVCSGALPNGTNICSWVETGEKREVISYSWKRYTGEILDRGNYTWRIEGRKEIGVSVDWIVSTMGKELTEWAWWDSYDGIFTIYNTTGADTFSVPAGVTNVSVLVVGGGAGGSGSAADQGGGGGGGAGGLIFNVSYTVTPLDDIQIYVGSGGGGGSGTVGGDGLNSTFGSSISYGGGGGGYQATGDGAGRDGASGGGQGGKGGTQGGGGTAIYGIQGNDGGDGIATAPAYPGGGGGGHTTAGEDGAGLQCGNGGNGTQYWGMFFAGGGGAGCYGAGGGAFGLGGLGGGGQGADTNDGYAGINGKGGGGGGAMGLVTVDDGGDGGDGIVIVRYLTIDSAPVVTLNSPIDAYNSTSKSITFNTTATDSIKLENVSLYLDGVINETNSSGYNGTYIFIKTFDDGDYNWTIVAFDNYTQNTTATTRTFTIDTIDPVINIISPLNQTTIISFNPTYNVSFNATITDANLDSCWYNNETANVTVTCGDNATINLTEGYHTLTWYANDSVGHEVSNSTTFFINYIQYNVIFTDPVVEGETDLVTFNLTTTNIDNLTAILEYNNINYTMTGTNNNTYGELNYTITAPIVASNTEVPLKVYYKLNGVNYTSIDYNQSVYFINPIEVAVSCSAGLSAAMYFNFTDAQNLTIIQNATINYNFKMGISNTSQKITSGSLTNIDSFYLCVNSTIYNNYTLGHGEISYSKEGWSIRRWYAFNNQRLSNTTINNTLYLLASGSSTSFLVTIQDPTLTAYPDIYTSLLRWYPSLDEYKVVEMGRTDNKGQTIKKIEVEDVDYRIGIYEQDGTLIYLASPIRMICIASPCSYTLTVVSVSGVEYSDFLGVEGELVYTDGVFLYTYNDPSQTTSSIYLNVTRVSGNNEILICQDTSSSFTGVLTCNVTGEQGLLKGIVFRSASPSKAIAILWIDNLTTVFQSPMGLFFVMIIVLTLFLVGIYYPVASIILGILALIPAIFLRVITYPIFIGIAVLAGIVLHFMRETR